MRYYLIMLLLVESIGLNGQSLEITLKKGDSLEIEGKRQLERIVKIYDVQISKWFFTKQVIIDKDAIPFSHPILTLNCKYLDNDTKQLANFLHEQFHWHVTILKEQETSAINEFRKVFPSIPVKGKEGARDEYSSYLHLIVCDLEFQAMTQIFGETIARRHLSEWNHYTWIYKTLLENNKVREINKKYGFIVL